MFCRQDCFEIIEIFFAEELCTASDKLGPLNERAIKPCVHQVKWLVDGVMKCVSFRISKTEAMGDFVGHGAPENVP